MTDIGLKFDDGTELNLEEAISFMDPEKIETFGLLGDRVIVKMRDGTYRLPVGGEMLPFLLKSIKEVLAETE